ncbi:MAG: phosphoglycerate mutase [Burkholderiales bacterium]|nr:phosphoglycerate mutase [Burkholderiales bacterium]
MSDGVHLLIPYAACGADGCHEAIPGLRLPHFQKLLSRLPVAATDPGEDTSLSPPHERVLARACGLQAPDGCIPWAAWQVRQAGRDAGGEAWAWITPCHWHVATSHIVMHHPQDLRLDADESKLLLAAMQPFFAQDGITLEYDAPTLWLARGEIFRGLATASLDRVSGRDIDAFVPRAQAARTLRRLQQEMQMLLYTHEATDARVRGGQLPVNSFWVSGTGALPSTPVATPGGLQVMHSLRDAALREDWPAWAAAWMQLDAQEGPRLAQALDSGRAVTLTLCGERSAVSRSSGKTGFFSKFSSVFGRQSASSLLETL